MTVPMIIQTSAAAILGAACLFTASSAEAASASRNCFETEEQAKDFTENLKRADETFHTAEAELQTLLQTPGLKYNALTFILGSDVKLQNVGVKPEAPTAHHQTMTHQKFHTHVKPSDTKMNGLGQYCTTIWSESHDYSYSWILDGERNILDLNIAVIKSW